MSEELKENVKIAFKDYWIIRESLAEKIKIMEDYLEQIVEPGLKSADKLDDFMRMTNYYNGQAAAYKHAISLCKKVIGEK